MQINKVITLFTLTILLVSLSSASTLMGLSGTILDNNGLRVNESLHVEIYDVATGGVPVYDSNNDDATLFTNAIINGSYNVMLGTNTTLALEYGQTYYLELEVGTEDVDFNSLERQAFVSSVGNITTITDVDITNLTVVTNLTAPTFCLNGVCRSTWPSIVETYNGTYDAVGDNYLYNTGTTLYLNETKLNATIVANGGGDTQKNTTGFYLYNDSTTIYFNETQLNVTIVALAAGGSGKTGVGYLYNNSGNMYLNESALNDTIDARATGVTAGWSNTSTITTVDLDVVINGTLNVTNNVSTDIFRVDPAAALLLLGENVTSTGSGVVFGTNVTLSNGALLGLGQYVSVAGLRGIGIGNQITAGNGAGDVSSFAMGEYIDVLMDHSFSFGYNNTVNADYAFSFGNEADVSGGTGGVAIGNNVDVSGTRSFGFGDDINVSGDTSVAFGLDNNLYQDCAQSNTMCVLGGRVGINTTTPSVTLEVAGDVNLTQNVTIGDVLHLLIKTVQPSGVTGAIIMYNDTTNVYPCYYNSTAWVKFENNSVTC